MRANAKSVVNSLEARPLLVGMGRSQVVAPGSLGADGLAYDLSDVALFRWLHPGEMWVAREPVVAEGDGLTFNQTQHLVVYGDDAEERCFETWLHPCAPESPESFECVGVRVNFFGTSAPAEPEDVVGVAGTIDELGGVTPGDPSWDGTGGLEMPFDSALDQWVGDVALPPGTTGSFAMYVRRADGTVVWENGERVLSTTGVDGETYQMQWF